MSPKSWTRRWCRYHITLRGLRRYKWRKIQQWRSNNERRSWFVISNKQAVFLTITQRNGSRNLESKLIHLLQTSFISLERKLLSSFNKTKKRVHAYSNHFFLSLHFIFEDRNKFSSWIFSSIDWTHFLEAAIFACSGASECSYIFKVCWKYDCALNNRSSSNESHQYFCTKQPTTIDC